jgi:hypothetical protein
MSQSMKQHVIFQWLSKILWVRSHNILPLFFTCLRFYKLR